MHCANHMAQLRQDYQRFEALNTEIVVLIPNGPRKIEMHVRETGARYWMLTDTHAAVAELYGIETNGPAFIKLFTSAVFVVDRKARIRYADYMPSYFREPDNEAILATLGGLEA